VAKRQLILGAILGVIAVGPVVDSASAETRVWRRQLPSFLEGDPEWPTGTLPTVTDLRSDENGTYRAPTHSSVSSRGTSWQRWGAWWFAIIRRLCWNLG
jgi:hypothetical protein